GADFIRDERLRQYLSTLAPDDEMGHVDLVLGSTPAPAEPPQSSFRSG
ncbi:hypothetical protein HA630_00450, partial [Aquabacterium sp. A08]|nr:hypothetical protein [Aquabacterium sp. A08]